VFFRDFAQDIFPGFSSGFLAGRRGAASAHPAVKLRWDGQTPSGTLSGTGDDPAITGEPPEEQAAPLDGG